MKLYLIRHGESVSNKNKLVSSNPPGPGLTEKGIVQVKELASQFRNIKIPDDIYVSPFKRTSQTYEILKKELLINNYPHIDNDIRELDYGMFNNNKLDFASPLIEKTMKRVLEGDFNIRFGITGENQVEFLTRVYSFTIKLLKNDVDAMIITHECIISVLQRLYKKFDSGYVKKKANFGELIELRFDKKNVKDIKKLIHKLRNEIFSVYYIKSGSLQASCIFQPSVCLPNLPISTPFTFAFTRNYKQLMLTLDKNGWWNPQGGHINKEEKWQEALIREAKEEAGMKIKIGEIIGFITINQLKKQNLYPDISIIPIIRSEIVKIYNKWQKNETLSRELVTLEKGAKLLSTRNDNNQMLEVYNYLIKYCLK